MGRNKKKQTLLKHCLVGSKTVLRLFCIRGELAYRGFPLPHRRVVIQAA